MAKRCDTVNHNYGMISLVYKLRHTVKHTYNPIWNIFQTLNSVGLTTTKSLAVIYHKYN